MSFLLDTNIVSFHLKHPRGLTHRFVQYSGRLYISSVALAELYVWAFGKAKAASALSAIEAMLRDEVNRLDFDDDCARKFGQLRVDLLRRGVGVNPMDLLIASVALVYDLTRGAVSPAMARGGRIPYWTRSRATMPWAHIRRCGSGVGRHTYTRNRRRRSWRPFAAVMRPVCPSASLAG